MWLPLWQDEVPETHSDDASDSEGKHHDHHY